MATRRWLFPLFLLILLAFGCGSLGVSGNQGSALINNDIDRDSTGDFDIEIDQPSESTIMPQLTQYDVKYEITIYNHTDAPVKVKRVALQSVGGGGSSLPPSTRRYERTIGPHGSEKIEFWATVNIANQRMPTLPNIVRATIDFDTNGTSRRENFTRNMGGGGSVAFQG
jgi:hypothetical protein